MLSEVIRWTTMLNKCYINARIEPIGTQAIYFFLKSILYFHLLERIYKPFSISEKKSVPQRHYSILLLSIKMFISFFAVISMHI